MNVGDLLRSPALEPVRAFKHALSEWAFRKRIHPVWVKDGIRRAVMRRSPIDLTRPFDREELRRTSLTSTCPPEPRAHDVPFRLFAFWMSEGPPTGRYADGLRELRDRTHVPVELVTLDALPRWVREEAPLPPAFRNLSAVHKSDYLRAYFMHHHGGGYADLKEPLGSWAGAFSEFTEEPDLWMIGAPNYEPFDGPDLHPRLVRRVRAASRNLTLQAAFICRPRTPLTAEWLAEADRLLRYYEDLLEEHPGGLRDEVVLYPVPWTRLLSQVLHPLEYKYLEHVRLSNALSLSVAGY